MQKANAKQYTTKYFKAFGIHFLSLILFNNANHIIPVIENTMHKIKYIESSGTTSLWFGNESFNLEIKKYVLRLHTNICQKIHINNSPYSKNRVG